MVERRQRCSRLGPQPRYRGSEASSGDHGDDGYEADRQFLEQGPDGACIPQKKETSLGVAGLAW